MRPLTVTFIVGKEPLRPSRTVDAALHAHILHTKDFAWFCESVVPGFRHCPEIDHEVHARNVMRQAVDYALFRSKQGDDLLAIPLVSRGFLDRDWTFLFAYLLSTEFPQFQGSELQAKQLVFRYLEAAVDHNLKSAVEADPQIRLVLESRLLHTSDFSRFRNNELGKGFEHTSF